MEITVFRDPPVGQEERALPAVQYNLARLLQARSPNGVAFVPIRSMQMLAILDDDEFVFLDSQYKSWVEVSWQNFRPQARGALDDPVPYEAVFYHVDGRTNFPRLQAEFFKALQALAGKTRIDGPAKLLKFASGDRSGPSPG